MVAGVNSPDNARMPSWRLGACCSYAAVSVRHGATAAGPRTYGTRSPGQAIGDVVAGGVGIQPHSEASPSQVGDTGARARNGEYMTSCSSRSPKIGIQSIDSKGCSNKI